MIHRAQVPVCRMDIMYPVAIACKRGLGRRKHSQAFHTSISVVKATETSHSPLDGLRRPGFRGSDLQTVTRTKTPMKRRSLSRSFGDLVLSDRCRTLMIATVAFTFSRRMPSLDQTTLTDQGRPIQMPSRSGNRSDVDFCAFGFVVTGCQHLRVVEHILHLIGSIWPGQLAGTEYEAFCCISKEFNELVGLFRHLLVPPTRTGKATRKPFLAGLGIILVASSSG